MPAVTHTPLTFGELCPKSALFVLRNLGYLFSTRPKLPITRSRKVSERLSMEAGGGSSDSFCISIKSGRRNCRTPKRKRGLRTPGIGKVFGVRLSVLALSRCLTNRRLLQSRQESLTDLS